ncbi:hypothetical protein B566_EDAN006178 [Ephemera danica]|nr:hypothetical protein B566_EDAN006178 [Ephemera danica]
MQDLQEVTQEVHYENYRSERLAKGAPVPKRVPAEKDRMLQEKEAELRRMQEMLAKMQAQMQQQTQN